MRNNHLIIMAGGIGSRFWPMSTPETPKQFVDVLGCGRSLIQLTVDRFRLICPPEQIWIVTSKNFRELVGEQLPEVPADQILLEPCMRNTAPCIAYVSWKIKARFPDANLIVSPADHLVMDVPEFQRVIRASLAFTERRKVILTLGMKPNRPETGYGYVEAEETSPSPQGEILKVASFHEKPDAERARVYVSNPHFYWNAGIFIWNVGTITEAIAVHQPALAEIFDRIAPAFYTEEEQAIVDRYFPGCASISIDYALLEKSSEVYVYPANFGWSDLGTWGSLHDRLEKDPANNVAVGSSVKLIESRNCMVHVPENKRVVIQGLDGYIVAEKDHTLLICRLSEEQRIKEFSKE